MAYNAYSSYDPAVQGYLTQAAASGAWSGRPFVSVEQSSLQQASDWGRHQQKKDIEWANQQRMYDPSYWAQALGMGSGSGGGVGKPVYVDTAGAYRTRLNSLMNNPDSISNTGAYKFAFNQGNEAVNRNLAAKGLLKSGNRLSELTKFGQGLASQQYGAEFDRMSNLVNTTRAGDISKYGADANLYGTELQGQNQLKALMMKYVLDSMQKPTQYGFGGGGRSSGGGGSSGSNDTIIDGVNYGDRSSYANPLGMWTGVSGSQTIYGDDGSKKDLYENSLTGKQEWRYR